MDPAYSRAFFFAPLVGLRISVGSSLRMSELFRTLRSLKKIFEQGVVLH
jgi:hypothetical protein